MILTDTGPIVALADEGDPYRSKVQAALAKMLEPMTTTDACLTEALYLLYRAGGWTAQNIIWNMFRTGLLTVIPTLETAPLRASRYMQRFQDQPCDYADATLLIAAEDTGQRSIFTLDKHFYAYRLSNGAHIEILR